jgi:hypothetical protein
LLFLRAQSPNPLYVCLHPSFFSVPGTHGPPSSPHHDPRWRSQQNKLKYYSRCCPNASKHKLPVPGLVSLSFTDAIEPRSQLELTETSLPLPRIRYICGEDLIPMSSSAADLIPPEAGRTHNRQGTQTRASRAPLTRTQRGNARNSSRAIMSRRRI